MTGVAYVTLLFWIFVIGTPLLVIFIVWGKSTSHKVWATLSEEERNNYHSPEGIPTAVISKYFKDKSTTPDKLNSWADKMNARTALLNKERKNRKK